MQNIKLRPSKRSDSQLNNTEIFNLLSKTEINISILLLSNWVILPPKELYVITGMKPAHVMVCCPVWLVHLCKYDNCKTSNGTIIS